MRKKLIELNLDAKDSAYVAWRQARRNEMKTFRESEKLLFSGYEDFHAWLKYYRWQKRPYEIMKEWKDEHGNVIEIRVKFLDYKEPKWMKNQFKFKLK